jgi:hypothetical protein
MHLYGMMSSNDHLLKRNINEHQSMMNNRASYQLSHHQFQNNFK